MISYALVVVSGTSESGFSGKLVDPGTPADKWLDVDVRFQKPEADRSLGYREQQELFNSAAERLAEFYLVKGVVQKSSLVRFDYAVGSWDPASGKPYLGVFAARQLCEPARTASVLAEAAALVPPADDDGMIGYHDGLRFASRISDLTGQAPPAQGEALRDSLVCADIYQHESEADRARHEPDEGLVYKRSDGEACMMAHHGGYLFWARENGTDVKDVGLHGREIEEAAPGRLYYFTGSPWGYSPDHNGEYDSGIDIDKFMPAEDAHLAMFGVEPGGFSEDIREYEEEADLPEEIPAAPSVG